MSIKEIARQLLELCYPAYCCLCGRSGAWVCKDCLNTKLYYEAFANCPKCPGLLRNRQLIHGLCKRRSCLDGVLAVCLYEESSKKLISALKYNFATAFVPVIASLLRDRISPYAGKYDLAVPVPLHYKRTNWRGFNQSSMLAAALPLPSLECLTRNRGTIAQARLSRKERLQNLQGNFKAIVPDAVKGLRILLIDDVTTTGATLEQCAAALKAAGAKTVTALVFAKDHSSFKPNILQ